jgi:hypothetical protein
LVALASASVIVDSTYSMSSNAPVNRLLADERKLLSVTADGIKCL